MQTELHKASAAINRKILVVSENVLISRLISQDLKSQEFETESATPEFLTSRQADSDCQIICVADCLAGDSRIVSRYGNLASSTGIQMLALIGRNHLHSLYAFQSQGFFGVLPSWYSRTSRLSVLNLAFEGEAIAPYSATEYTPAVWMQSSLAGELGISSRELDVLSLIVCGKKNTEIAKQLEIAEPTVKMHVSALGRKLKARNRTEIAYRCLKGGLISLSALKD